MTIPLPEYAELHCISNFTFLRGASHPAELVGRASRLGYAALAITDECSVAGIVRAHAAARGVGLKLIVGAEFRLTDGLQLLLLAMHRQGYGQLCELITRARRAAVKGDYRLDRQGIGEACLDGCLAIWIPATGCAGADDATWVRERFPGRSWLGVELLADGNDQAKLDALTALSRASGVPAVATGDVHMHVRGRRALQDALSAIRLKTTLAQAGDRLHMSGERHLRPRLELARIYPPELLQETVRIAGRVNFSLDELRYEYPEELVPAGETPASHLRQLTEAGMRRRWPSGVTPRLRAQIEHELTLITELAYEPYFLTVHDIVRHARQQGILCQGRGSAANSAVCYCLGITEVDPARMSMLVERFISRERNEPPDIDVDFEHERREEVIQYVYRKYGRERAALAAAVISYCPRSALRDLGKALGLTGLQVERLSRAMQWWDGRRIMDERITEAGLDPGNPTVRRLVRLARDLIGFPRHLSQHVGGFVIARGALSQLVPVENAAMPERTVIQWDKDDLDELGLLKVDILGLGMLSAIRRSLGLINAYYGRSLTVASVPAEDPQVYDMIGRADTIGVFQIESRAQMAMLPRLRPRCYYDLVIEVAIIRPGPIQGDMVHPYLRRRNGEEPVSYPSPEVERVLARTLGVPIFQEQVMQLAVVAAGFSPGEADQLRRAMAAWRRRGGLEPFEQRLLEGMRRRGYRPEFAQQIFRQILGFGEYGFPESHAASFALLVYVSAWLKCHEPAAFTCALLNSQPMGFYAPSQLVQDVRRHGVAVRPVDINRSGWDCSLEPGPAGRPAVRLGLRLVNGLSSGAGDRIGLARKEGLFTSAQDLAERARLGSPDLHALASCGALVDIAGHRHRAVWEVAGVEQPLPLLPQIRINEGIPLLPPSTESENVAADYECLGLTLARHPVALLRTRLRGERCLTAQQVWKRAHDSLVHTAGLVITRQRPGSAGGVIFVTLEDETGHINLIVWQSVAERQRRILLQARLLGVWGRVQRDGDVLHVIAGRLEDHSRMLAGLKTASRDFH
ncbi:MAG: error-prone DNA polymerase [Gammaproteobacteria bacterium]|nr:error-prone DNA polymerase [Gammaproteobacteria bacterium]